MVLGTPMTAPVCPACNGSGKIARTGTEANPLLHPYLSQTLGCCWTCGGSGRSHMTAAQLKEAADKAAAAATAVA